MKDNKWTETEHGGILQGKGFHISYVKDTGMIASGEMDKILNVLQGANDGGEETALVKTNVPKYKFFILNGDFRKEYEKLVPEGYGVCKKFFNKNEDSHSTFSN